MAEYIPQFATGYAFSANDLFTRFKLHYIKKSTYEAFHEHSKKAVAARVFIYMFYLILIPYHLKNFQMNLTIYHKLLFLYLHNNYNILILD